MDENQKKPEEEFQHRKFAKEMHDHVLAKFPELRHENEWVTMVRVFHKVYGQPLRMSPASLSEQELLLRRSLIDEEFTELMQEIGALFAKMHDDDTEALQEQYEYILDALGDLVYVIMGFFIFMGIDPSDIMREIQLSNMSKLGSDGKPILRADGKVLKGPNYFRPDFARFVRGMK